MQIHNETKTFKVTRKETGLEYMLFPKGNETYYLSTMDGMDGQTIIRTDAELNDMFTKNA